MSNIKNFKEYRSGLSARMAELRVQAPSTMAAFGKLHESTMAEGAIGTKHKELMALAIGISSRCDGCIAFHVNEALKTGASRQEIVETIGVCIVMGGGPSLMYCAHAMEALQQFEAEYR